MDSTSLTGRAAIALAVSALALTAQATTFSVAHEFAGTDGSWPFGALTLDSAGNVYGAAYAGGTANFGTLFKFDGARLTTLYSFTGGSDGGNPEGSLLADAEGNLYGTTKVGGGGYGTVFRWDRELQPHLRTLKSFVDRAADGVSPSGGLARDADGTLYGTTFFGGNLDCATQGLGCGTVFKVAASGAFTQLHRFNGTDGYGPNATLYRVGDRLFGTTVYWGPSPAGSPYSMKAADGTSFTTVTPNGVSYNFIGGLVRDANGNLWGVAFIAGTTSMGGIYRIDPSGNYQLMHTFNGSDGAYPTGTPILDAQGMLYGTTEGAAVWGSEGSGPGGYGTVFRYDTASGTLTTLHRFTGPDGKNPVAGLVRDPQGNLYGVTAYGGANDKGVLFRVTP
ncbi:MAG: hypothetical protein JSR59_09270 [Proteobacteria bacterium]|nr:hypothetical protein [Pseudomonadota bacterium]